MPSTEQRLRVLLCWGYHRRGWIAPFEQLDREFDFHYIFHLSKDEEERSYTPRPRHYWNDFRSAQEILDEIAPDRLVFMSLSGLRPIALNMVARSRGIPTLIFQHGYFGTLENYLSLGASSSKVATPAKASMRNSAPAAIRFLLRSTFLQDPSESLQAIAMLLEARRAGYYRSQLRFRFHGRMPDRYITYSEATSALHRELDSAQSSSIIPVGIPEFDPIFRRLASSQPRGGKHVLLIDSPTAENRYGVTTTSIDIKARFLTDLSQRLRDRGYPLIVKLHPETYEADWLPDNAGIEYIRDGDVGSLIQGARACIGFDSTLVIPAVIARPTMLFELSESTLITGARELGVAIVVGGLECSDRELDALLESEERPPESLREFTKRFAHSADGFATRRLARALTDLQRLDST